MITKCVWCQPSHFLSATCPYCGAPSVETEIADEYRCLRCGIVSLQIESDSSLSSTGMCKEALERVLREFEAGKEESDTESQRKALRAARGLVIGGVVSCGIWAAICWLLWLFFKF